MMQLGCDGVFGKSIEELMFLIRVFLRSSAPGTCPRTNSPEELRIKQLLTLSSSSWKWYLQVGRSSQTRTRDCSSCHPLPGCQSPRRSESRTRRSYGWNKLWRDETVRKNGRPRMVIGRSNCILGRCSLHKSF
jgi:hypothetical protein